MSVQLKWGPLAILACGSYGMSTVAAAVTPLSETYGRVHIADIAHYDVKHADDRKDYLGLDVFLPCNEEFVGNLRVTLGSPGSVQKTYGLGVLSKPGQSAGCTTAPEVRSVYWNVGANADPDDFEPLGSRLCIECRAQLSAPVDVKGLRVTTHGNKTVLRFSYRNECKVHPVFHNLGEHRYAVGLIADVDFCTSDKPGMIVTREIQVRSLPSKAEILLITPRKNN